jgi:RNA polymerase sigma factor (sigma-70 family)
LNVYVVGLRRPDERIDELVEDAITHAIIRIQECRAQTDGMLVRWFRVIARNFVYQYVRSVEAQQAQDTVPLSDAIEAYAVEESGYRRLSVERQLVLRFVREAYENLSEDQRTILAWRRSGEEWSVIAEHLGISIGAAKQRGNRAKMQMREQIRGLARNFRAMGPEFQEYLVRIGILDPTDLF